MLRLVRLLRLVMRRRRISVIYEESVRDALDGKEREKKKKKKEEETVTEER